MLIYRVIHIHTHTLTHTHTHTHTDIYIYIYMIFLLHADQNCCISLPIPSLSNNIEQCWEGATTLSIMTLSIMTFSVRGNSRHSVNTAVSFNDTA
jgi:hypothetical protein